jgi:hypothetical protein
MPNNKVDQSRSTAGGDNVGRDKRTTVYNFRPNKIDGIVAKLRQEQEDGTTTDEKIEALQYYMTPVSPDGVVGLEEKLKVAGRVDQLPTALREKELFAKFLERWSHFASAQALFAHLLAAVEQRFNSYLYPRLGELSRAEFDAQVHERVVEPVMAELGDEPLGINATVVCGMIYWLAEQCFVRWHKRSSFHLSQPTMRITACSELAGC